MRDSLLDLFIGARCAACSSPGRLICSSCAAGLPRSGRPAWPDPAPPGLLTPYAAGAYEVPLKPLLVGLKERRQVGLTAPLGGVLGAVVADLLAAEAGRGDRLRTTVLVPVPSSAAARRARGIDHTLGLARGAARTARELGVAARVVPALRHRGGARDQAGLSRAERARNASGRFVVRPAAIRVLRRLPDVLVVVVDDILTTGHTLCEAQSALSAAGLEVVGGAVVAATERGARAPRKRVL